MCIRDRYQAFQDAFERISGIPWAQGREQTALEGPSIDRAFTEVDGKVLAEGAKLSELAPVMSGLQSGEATAYDISVSWPENAPEIDNKYQAGAVSFDFQVDATQLDGAAITNGDNAGNWNPRVSIDDLTSHEIKVGLRYNFGASDCCAQQYIPMK